MNFSLSVLVDLLEPWDCDDPYFIIDSDFELIVYFVHGFLLLLSANEAIMVSQDHDEVNEVK